MDRDKNYLAKLKENGLKKVIALPDSHPARGAVEIGSVLVFDRDKHRVDLSLIGDDIGCGISVYGTKSHYEDLKSIIEETALRLRGKRKGLGTLGSGNHFIDFAIPIGNIRGMQEFPMYTLIHSGQRGYVYEIMNRRHPLDVHEDCVRYANENRDSLAEIIERVSRKKLHKILNKPHNTIEIRENEIIYRKGAVQLNPGEVSIVPVSVLENAHLIRANDKIIELENSMVHGTGRVISRSESKNIIQKEDMDKLREQIMMPSFANADSLRTEHPLVYRSFREIFPQIENYVSLLGELKPVGYIGHI